MSFDPVFSGLWLYGDTGDTTTAPPNQCWNWNEADLVVTEVAVAGIDEDSIDRLTELATVLSHDRLHLRNTTTADNWAMFDIVAVEDLTTWFLFTLELVGTGTVTGLPVFRQRVLFDFMRPVIIGAPVVTPADVETWLGVDVGSLDQDELERVIGSVRDWANRLYDLVTQPLDTEQQQALIMRAAQLYTRKHSINGYSGSDDLVPIPARSFDPEIDRLLSPRLRTAGLFGPSSNTTDEA